MAQSGREFDFRSSLYRGLGWLVVLAIAAACAGVFLVALDLVRPEQLVGGWATGRDALALAGNAEGTELLVIAVGAVLIGILAIAILLSPGSPRTRSSSLHLLVSDDHGFVVVDSQGIARVAELAAVSAQGVLDANVRVEGSGMSPIRMKVDVGVVPGANIKQAGEEVREAVRDAVVRLVGIDVRDVNAAVHVMEPEEFGRLLQ